MRNTSSACCEVVYWYKKHRQGKEETEIFIYYSTAKDKKYTLPKENLALFNNLDKPYSTKRVVLLVAVGTEGWDCKSLTGVALPRKDTSKNFVLQTTCRCLREVDNANNEKALIYLNEGNYDILDSQLQENYRLSIADLKNEGGSNIAVQIRKPKLGKLKYKQVKTSYKVIKKTVSDYKDTLKKFNFDEIIKHYDYDDQITQSTIGRQNNLTKTSYISLDNQVQRINFNLNDFLYLISEETYSRISEQELWQNYYQEMKNIFQKIIDNIDWLENNPKLQFKDVIEHIASYLTDEVKYEMDTIEEDTEIELLEWEKENPELPLFSGAGSIYKMMPRIENIQIAKLYQKRPSNIEDDINESDINNISYNYAPYKMDSDFERNALEKMLQIAELKNLELYFNGYKDSYLQSFWIQTPRGVYTPDFLVIKRKATQKYEKGKINNEIEKVLILETKGSTYYNDEFKEKEKFVKDIFLKYNPKFKYECFIDDGGNIFNTNKFRKIIAEL